MIKAYLREIHHQNSNRSENAEGIIATSWNYLDVV